MRKNLSHLAGYLSHQNLSHMKIFLISTLCLYDQTGRFAYQDLAPQRPNLGERDEQKSI